MAHPSPSFGAPAMDGRHARTERTRSALAEALLGLLGEGELRPTAARVAERAGVSLRLVFHHFQDMEAIFQLAAARHFERVLAGVQPVPTAGPLPLRLRAFVRERCRLLEQMAPVRRAALLVEPFSPAVALWLAQSRALSRGQTQAVFGRELSALEPGPRAQTARALGAASSFSFWEALRAHQGLSAAAASGVVTRTLHALLSSSTGLPNHRTPRRRHAAKR